MKEKLIYIVLCIACVSMIMLASCTKKENPPPAEKQETEPSDPSEKPEDSVKQETEDKEITIKKAEIQFCNT